MYAGLQGVEQLPVFLGRPYHCEYGANWTANPFCWSHSPDEWALIVRGVVAPPGAPSGDALTVPPASGDDAQAVVDALLNQQLADQQKLNAGGVQSTWWDEVTGGASAAADKATEFPWLLMGGLALGAFALVAVSGGSPRRYGR